MRSSHRATRPNQTRRLLASFLIAFFLFSNIPSPVKACPMPPPQPLRELYLASDLIVVARIGESSLVKEKKNRGEAKQVRTRLYVNQVIKGDAASQVININRFLWDEAQFAKLNTPDDESFPYGKTMLAFLKHGEMRSYGGMRLRFVPVENSTTDGKQVDEDALPIVDDSMFYFEQENYGAKVLDDDGLKVYLQRIDDLARIYADDKPDIARLTEWIVRCIEHPATRWEGAYELMPDFAFYSAVSDETTAASEVVLSEPETINSDKTNDEKPSDESTANAEEANEYVDEGEQERLKIISLLTDAHRTRIADSVFNAKKLTQGEFQLLPLTFVSRDKRLTSFILEHLRRKTGTDDDEYMNSQLMTIVARALGNQAAFTAAEKYQEVCYQENQQAQSDTLYREFLTLIDNPSVNPGVPRTLASIHDSADEEN
ncbi:MAG: hypothetical protein MSG64_05780 [Pyrinomonadaceae bacterium MAG19_C2-C3]|nr:hypothetical protein [Pyrinomonadaceae bacterium MAG19_C2-C3]